MKKVSMVLAVAALLVGGLSVNPKAMNGESAVQEADAGAISTLIFWHRGFQNDLGNWCNKSVNRVDWQPLRFMWFGATCVLGVIFGDEDANQSATSYLSADHAYVTKGIKTAGGTKVKYSEAARKFHNDHRDDFVDAAEAAREELDDYRVKDGGATTEELLKDFQKIIAKNLEKELGKDKEFDTPAGREALQNFVALQFNTGVKKETKKEK